MTRAEMIREDCKLSWREQSQAQANTEANDLGLTGDAALTFVQGRAAEIYRELKASSDENIREI